MSPAKSKCLSSPEPLSCAGDRRMIRRKAAPITAARGGEMRVDPAPSAPFPGRVSQGDAPWRIN
jgi:hypothetical protein